MNIQALIFAAIFSAGVIAPLSGAAAEWIRAGINTNQPMWGIRGGLQFAIPPGGFTWGDGGPRGLIRIGYPSLSNRQYDLINFIAVEPVVKGRRAFSELERSASDGKQGKLFTVGLDAPQGRVAPKAGTLRALTNGVEELEVSVAVERFDNGAHVWLLLSQRSDAPDELRLRVNALPDSAPLDQCILTATMGNKARTRVLWLNGKSITSHQLYGEYRGDGFTEHTFFPVAQLPRNRNGDVLVAVSNDELNPSQQLPGLSRFWQYRGDKVTQYWRKPANAVTNDLQCAVNARFKYWMSQTPVPGGIAFENFELVQRFREGQEFVFGVTTNSPESVLK